jgi:hypothetical protein
MFRKNAWRWAALTVAAALGPRVVANAAEPPSSKVARWHDELCPRDLTPFVTGPCYGYYPTRWRVMPPCDAPADLVLPPTTVSVGPPGKPASSKGAGSKAALGPSPYGAPRELRPKADWTARPALPEPASLRPVSNTRTLAGPEKRESGLYPPPE